MENNHWEVRSKDGLISYYGIRVARRDDPAVVADPDYRANIFVWKLTDTQDSYGNRIVYEYTRNAGEPGDRAWDQLYFTRIRYIDYTGGSSSSLSCLTMGIWMDRVQIPSLTTALASKSGSDGAADGSW